MLCELRCFHVLNPHRESVENRSGDARRRARKHKALPIADEQ
jgi:hypothetical protein